MCFQSCWQTDIPKTSSPQSYRSKRKPKNSIIQRRNTNTSLVPHPCIKRTTDRINNILKKRNISTDFLANQPIITITAFSTLECLLFLENSGPYTFGTTSKSVPFPLKEHERRITFIEIMKNLHNFNVATQVC